QGLDRRVDRVILHITDRLVLLVAREVEAGRTGEMRQGALDAGVFVIFPILLLGLAPGAADNGSAVEKNQDAARVAPVRRSAAADVGDEIAGDTFVRPKDEDAFGMRRSELAPAGRRAGLVQHRYPLRRRLGQMDRIHLIVSALMPDAMDFGRIGENPVGLVAQPAPSSQLASHNW